MAAILLLSPSSSSSSSSRRNHFTAATAPYGFQTRAWRSVGEGGAERYENSTRRSDANRFVTARRGLVPGHVDLLFVEIITITITLRFVSFIVRRRVRRRRRLELLVAYVGRTRDDVRNSYCCCHHQYDENIFNYILGRWRVFAKT